MSINIFEIGTFLNLFYDCVGRQVNTSEDSVLDHMVTDLSVNQSVSNNNSFKTTDSGFMKVNTHTKLICTCGLFLYPLQKKLFWGMRNHPVCPSIFLVSATPPIDNKYQGRSFKGDNYFCGRWVILCDLTHSSSSTYI